MMCKYANVRMCECVGVHMYEFRIAPLYPDKYRILKNKVFATIFFILAVLLSLGVIGQLPEFIKVISGFIFIFTGKLNAEQIGFNIGQLVFWVIYLFVTYLFWKIAFQYSKNSKEVSKTNRKT